MAQRGGKRPNSGRKPGAVSKEKRILAEMAMDYAEAALTTLSEVMRLGQSESARVTAANAILDRAYGKPFQAVHHAGHDGGALPSVDPTKLSLSALQELIAARVTDIETPGPNAS